MHKMSIDDDGILEVALPDGTTVELDVFVASDRFSKAIADANEDAAQQAVNLAAAMAEHGIPEMSYRAHLKICTTCQKIAIEAQKKDGLILPAPDAPGSHGTTS